MRHSAWTLVLWLAATAALAPVPAAADDAVERLTAFAVNMSGAGRARAGTVDIVIERWSTADERSRLAAALREGGTDELLDQLRGIDDRVGYIASAGRLGYPLRFAHQIALPGGGQRLLLGTDRPVAFLESGPASRYPFMIIDIRIRPDGQGEGRLLPIARVEAHPDNVIEIENYLAQPVRLTSVRRRG